MAITRRKFIDTLAVSTTGLALATTARSYARILGSNERVNFAVIGLNGRAYAHLAALKASRKEGRISHVCAVESTILQKVAGQAESHVGQTPVVAKLFRKVLEAEHVEPITLGPPD